MGIALLFVFSLLWGATSLYLFYEYKAFVFFHREITLVFFDMSEASNNSRIAKNTMYLYLRSILVMGVSIYTSRVVLQALGVSDYGIYNVVGGFVSMFSLLSSAMTSASQRFISYEMGREEPQMNRLFCGTISIHLILAVAIFILFESFGIWFLNTQLNIESNRLYAANWVFQCSVLSFCINLISIPYNATIIAHERMNVFAVISIYEVFAKLGIVYLLWLTHFDKLIIYAILILLVSVSLRLIYGIYCSRHFEECKFEFSIDKELFKSMLGFTGWNFIGTTAGIFSTQGINILVNIFWGVVLNAARGISEQVNGAINTFVTNFMTALNPQITQNCAAGNYRYMNSLIIRGGKYAALLYWSISLVIFIESDYILRIWLVEVPEYASLFLKLSLIYSLFLSLSHTLYIGILATGKIKKYQIVVGTINGFSFILCYIGYLLGAPAEWCYISTIIIAMILVLVRLKLLNVYIPDFSGKEYLKNTILKVFIVVMISIAAEYLVKYYIHLGGIVQFAMSCIVALLILPISIYIIALDTKERKWLAVKLQERGFCIK